MKYCSKCGSQINDDAVFCAGCGTRVSDNNTNQNAENLQPTAEQTTNEENPNVTNSKYRFTKSSDFIFDQSVKLIFTDCVRSTVLLAVAVCAVASVFNVFFAFPFSGSGSKSGTAVGAFYQA